MRKSGLAFLLTILAACDPDPAECTERGNDEACHKLCETGKEELTHLCYTPRARKLLACLDDETQCATACADWVKADDQPIRGYYEANIGSTEKVAAIDAKCNAEAAPSP